MAIGDDWVVDYTLKKVYHNSGTTVYTVNALYSWLQDTFDELAALDDTVPMTAQTPTNYTLANGWFMDVESFQYLKGGAVITSGYADAIRIVSFGGTYTNAVAGDIGKIVTGGTTGDTGKLLAYNNTTKKWWVRMDAADDLFDAAETVSVTADGGTGTGTSSGASNTGEELWPNLYTLGTIDDTDSQLIYIVQNGSRLASGSEWWPDGSNGQHIDVLVKIKDADNSSGIDSGKLTIFLRHYPNTADKADLYDHFNITISPSGTGDRNAIPLATSLDINNTSPSDTAASYNSITIAFVNGTVPHGTVTGSFANFEVVTYTGDGSGIMLKDTITGSSGLMTLGNLSDNGPGNAATVTGATNGATATTIAATTLAHTMYKAFEQDTNHPYDVIIDCATRTVTQLYEYLKYVTRIGSTFTTYGMKTQSSSLSMNRLEGQQYITAYNNIDSSGLTYSPQKQSPLGTFAGGRFFGARGVWIENMADSDVQAFQLKDANDAQTTPPNKQSITVTNLLSGDRVAVFRTTSGTTINKAMYYSGAANNSGDTTFDVSASIAVDTPSTGSIRIVDIDNNTNRETRYTYSSWDGTTFTLATGLDRSYTEGSDTAYVPFIDAQATSTTASVLVIYTADRSVLVRVRRKTATAIIPFETTGTFASNGFSVSTIRTTDSIVS